MHCIKPIILTKGLSRLDYPDGLEVPCGKCVECRISKRREWSMRLIHELTYYGNNACFTTLTYSDDHIPDNDSLRKTDLQKFIKRLRKGLHKDHKIKYFACGEYGDPEKILPNGQISIGNRPHYHGIIFGLSKKDEEYIQNKWGKGHVDVGLAEPNSIQYVAQYIDKKYTGELAEQEYTDKNREPVFKVSSNGLGKRYALENSKQLINNEKITLNGVNMGFPRYYLKLLDLEKSEFRKNNAIKKDIENVKKITGVEKTFMEYYKSEKGSEVKKLNDHINNDRIQKNKNTQARIDLKSQKN